MSLVIVDTGVANLASVKFAFERMNTDAVISRDACVIDAASHVILPGVGAAPAAMRNIDALELTSVLKARTKPMMGICLGMQLLFEELDEGGQTTQGLGLIAGRISKLDTGDQPSPHMGWNQLSALTNDPVLDGISAGDYAYFVHSFAAPITDHVIAASAYGQEFAAIVRKGNIYGCQFHPERSSATGARILANFLKVSP